MANLSKPIPALYAVYVLRSTVRHASLYIGSTPNPPRRLKQHNGEAPGGAVRTSRKTLRPWEMITLVTGFPSMVAALKFEWALNNPHVSLHIPTESRITISTQKKKGGAPRRPPHSLKSIIANVHLLLGVQSFARWPLSLHFFTKDAHTAWDARLKTLGETPKAAMKIYADYEPASASGSSTLAPRGIHALSLDYSPIKSYVTKAHNIVSFEREGKCAHCKEELESGKGLYPMCPNEGCEAMGHLDCWSQHALDGEEGDALIPEQCRCPFCGDQVVWGDMMKELSLRVRGAKEVEKLLKKKRATRKALTQT